CCGRYPLFAREVSPVKECPMRRAAGSAALGLLLLAAPLKAAGPAPPAAPAPLDAGALAARIDHHVAMRWKAKSAKPAELAGGAEFLRRICLDLTGRIPDIIQTRDFLDNPARDKRARLID